MPAPSQRPAPPSQSAFDVDPGEKASFLLRSGTAIGLAAAASLVGAVPAAMRIATAAPTENAAGVWVGLAAAALLPMVAAVVVLRGAGAGLRAFGGPGAEFRAFGVALWAALLLVGFTYFGSILRATTHHHALAGATFAIGGALLAVGLALVCARLVAILGEGSPLPAGVRHVVAGGLAVGVAAAVGWVGVRFLGASSRVPGSEPAAGMVVDVLAFVLTALFAARRSFASRRALALVGPPMALAVLWFGIAALRDPLLRAAIEERAPAFAAVVDDVPGP